MVLNLVILILLSMAVFVLMTENGKASLEEIQPDWLRRLTILISVPVLVISTFLQSFYFSWKEVLTNLALIW